VEISQALNLPKYLCDDVQVQYFMDFEEGVGYRTQPVKGKQLNPQFNYQQLHIIEKIDEKVLKSLKESTVCFEITAIPRLSIMKNQAVSIAPKVDDNACCSIF
jgi:hypothetical protein